MDAELKTKWVNALRSGEYKQGNGALKTNKGEYCCLGVLVDVIDSDAWTGPYGGRDYYTWDGASAYLPKEIESEQSLTPFVDTLIDMNDSDKAPFTEIADYIEENIPAEEKVS